MQRKFYNNALEANPFYGNAALGLGRVFTALGNKENALEAFQVAADISPSHTESQYKLAECLFEAGNLEEAANYCLKAMEIDRNYTPTHTLMNKLLKSKLL